MTVESDMSTAPRAGDNRIPRPLSTPALSGPVGRLLAGPDGLYLGLWADDSESRAIRHAELRPYADFGSDDSFTLLVDPLRDRRTGFWFSVNQNGAMANAAMLLPRYAVAIAARA